MLVILLLLLVLLLLVNIDALLHLCNGHAMKLPFKVLLNLDK